MLLGGEQIETEVDVKQSLFFPYRRREKRKTPGATRYSLFCFDIFFNASISFLFFQLFGRKPVLEPGVRACVLARVCVCVTGHDCQSGAAAGQGRE